MSKTQIQIDSSDRQAIRVLAAERSITTGEMIHLLITRYCSTEQAMIDKHALVITTGAEEK
jgi:hypothetical protein